MFLTDKQLTKFKALYKKHFDEDLTPEDAYEKATKLVRMMQIVYKPMTVAQYLQVMEDKKRLGFINEEEYKKLTFHLSQTTPGSC